MNVLVVGRSGMVARELTRCFRESGREAVAMGRPELCLQDAGSIRNALDAAAPGLVINAGAYTAVDRAEEEPELALLINRDGARRLAETCHRRRIPLIHLSTDYVFSGRDARPIPEESPAEPLNVYGRSKWEGEEAVRAACERHLIIRTAWLYGRHGTNFLTTMLRMGKEQREIRVVNDRCGCPTWTRDVARALLALCDAVRRGGESATWGTFHFCGAGQTTWYEFAKAVFAAVDGLEPLKVGAVIPVSSAARPAPAARPASSVLCCKKIQAAFGIVPPDWRDSLAACLQEMYA